MGEWLEEDGDSIISFFCRILPGVPVGEGKALPALLLPVFGDWEPLGEETPGELLLPALSPVGDDCGDAREPGS